MRILQEITKAKQANKPFVAFSNPNEKLVTFFRQQTDELFVFSDVNQSGYVFAPFDDKEDAYILKPDVVFTDKKASDILPIDSLQSNSFDVLDKRNHMELVKKTIATIQNSSLSKIVISRKEKVQLIDFNVASTFDQLLNLYKNAYVYVWYHPKVGLWLGATPETLLQLKGHKFKTMALAGTQPYQGNLNPTWGDKELQEQQMVVDFICTNISNITDDLVFSDLETVKAGNLLHLKTSINGTLKSLKHIGEILKLLHPTPAVCGLPKQKSKEYILKNEGYHRSFYTGYLGAFNYLNKTDLYVNLRCFQVTNNTAEVYIGGGITASSHPESEWLETVAKSETIKRVLL